MFMNTEKTFVTKTVEKVMTLHVVFNIDVVINPHTIYSDPVTLKAIIIFLCPMNH